MPLKSDPKLNVAVYDGLGYTSITNNIDNGPKSKAPVWAERAGAQGVRIVD